VGWVIAAILVLAGIGAVLGFWWHPGWNPVALAKGAYEKGDWERAVERAREALKTRSDPEALRIYARALARLQRDEAALAIYNGRLEARLLDPEDRFLVGLMLARTGKLETALGIWEAAVQEGADQPELLDHLSRLAFRLQRMDLSAEAARRLARQPGWEARGLLILGEVQSMIDNTRGAVDALRSALEHDPHARGAPFDAAHYRKLLARNLLQIGRAAEAQEQLETVVANSGTATAGERTDREAYWLLSRAFLQQRRLANATDALARSGPYRTENRLMPEPSPYVGSARCAACHAEIARLYHGTRHTRTFHHGPGLLALPIPDHPLIDPDDPKVTHTFERNDQRIQVQTRAGDKVFNTVVEYAFGTRDHYLTMIGRDQEKNSRALRLSYYHTPNGSGWGRTSGDVGRSDSIEDVRGQRISVRDGVVRCLYCHVTQSRDFRDPPPEGGASPAAADGAIGCERCHGPGGNHLLAISADFADPAIVNVEAAPAATVTTQCAECHVVGAPSDIQNDPTNPQFVRSPGLTLTFSRCYTDSSGGMSCSTCHLAHRPAERAAAYYESICLSCHSPDVDSGIKTRGDHTASSKPAGGRTTCPVNPVKDCLNCHMPKIPIPELHKTLTDHYIRVRGANAPPRESDVHE
jgi:hypothetical protein